MDNTMKNTFKLTLDLKYTIIKKEKWFLAHCPCVDVMTQGKTRKEAIKNIKEAVGMFFQSCIERSVLGDVLAGKTK